MSTQKTTWILELLDKITSPMKGVTDSTNKAQDGVENLGKSLKNVSAMDLRAISESVGDLSNMLNQASAPGIAFDSQLKEVEAITGVTGDALDKLGDKARDTAKIFGGDASAMMESYKGVLSRLGPDIAKNQLALAAMGTDIATLSKTMSGDAVGAMDALTTSVLQFGVDLSDPNIAAGEMTRMMNVMAAGAKEGASEVTQISEALKQAGVQALNSNVSFEETNSALQALAQGGKFGSEAGVALRNVLGKMAGIDVVPREAASKLKALGVNYDIVANKSLPFTSRLRELGKAQGDATIMAQIFGTENAAAAQILLRSADYQDTMTKKITGTNTAVEQANIIMGSYTEKIAKTKAWFSDLGISIFGVTKYILPFVTGLAGAVMVLANLANARTGITLLMTTLRTMPVVGAIVNSGFNLMSLGAKGLGVAIMNIPIIGWIAAVIVGLIAVGTYFYNTSSSFRGALWGVWSAIKTVFSGIGEFVGKVCLGIFDVLKGVFNPANWFDSNYHFSDGLKKIADAATEYGKKIGESFSKGKEAGMEDYYKENPTERPGFKTKEEKDAEVSKINAAKMAAYKKELAALAGDKSKDAEDKRGRWYRAMDTIIPGSSSQYKLQNAAKPLIPTKPNEGGLSGSGSGVGGAKNITQKIDIKNYFTLSGGVDIEAIAEKVVRAINDRLRDATVALQ